MATYYLTSLRDTTDTAETAYFAKTSVGTLVTAMTASIAKSTTTTWLWNTEYNIPRQATWGTPTISASIVVTASGTSVAGTLKVKNLTTGQTSAAGTSVAMTAAGTFTLTAGSLAFTGTSVGDRLQIQLAVTNSSTASRTFTFSVNSTTGSSMSSNITEFSDASGVVIPSAQYASDESTLVPAGSYTGLTDANTQPLYIETDVLSYGLGYATTVNFEVIAAASSFTNTASNSATAHALRTGPLITARRGATLAYDSKNKRYLCIGGYDGTNRFNDLWELSSDQIYARWKKLAPTGSGPAVFNLGALTSVNLNGKCWLVQYGGANSAGSPTGNLYICDVTTPGSEAWTTVTQTNSPGVNYYNTHHLVVVPTSSTAADVYLFGGGTASTTYVNYLYKFTLNLASTVPTALTWTTVKANGAAGNPGVRDGAFCCYDSAGNRILIAAGYGGTTGTQWTDVWQYSIASGTFTQLTTSGDSFVWRELPSGGWDQTNKRIILFGGWQTTVATSQNDIWQIDCSGSGTAVYTQIKATDTTNGEQYPFSSGAACVDTDKNIIVEFGQNGIDTTDKYVYAYDLSTTASSTAGKTLYGLNVQDHFRGRDAPAYCYDTSQGNMLLINGFSGIEDDTTANIPKGDHHQEIWGYNISANTLTYSNKDYIGMPNKEGVLAIYDSIANRVITFGGLTGNGQFSNATWELTADAASNYMARPMAPSGTPPPSRWLMAGLFDATNNRIIIWGGCNASTVYNTMYQLDLTSGDGTWSSLSPTGTVPTAVWQPSFANDTANKRLYVYGGCTNTGDSTYSSQLFYIDYSTSTPAYNTLSPTGGTTGRGKALGFDATNNQLIAFGGYNGSTTNQIQNLSLASPTAWASATPTVTPTDRRSCAYAFVGSSLYIAAGRQNAGQFWNDVWQLTPNYTTLSSSTWTNKNPGIYQRFQVPITGKTNGTTYKWQAWESTSSVLSSKVTFSTNAFTVGLTPLFVNVDPSNSTYVKPNLNIQVI